LPASAEAYWQFRGHVENRKRTSIQLVVRHRGNRPKTLIAARTGPIRLRCERGSATARLEIESFIIDNRVDRRGRFAADGFHGALSITHGHPRVRIVKSSVRGRLADGRAAGFLRVKANRHGRKGKCDSGLRRWHARFVPRAG
jgi:hypothetical protein